MRIDTGSLNGLINVLEDGRSFYDEAANEAARADLKALFARMARTKRMIANDLRARVVAGGEEPADGSLAGSLRKKYAEIRTRLADDPDAEYVAQLEEFEDRILKEFQEQVEKSDDPGVRGIALKYLPEVRRDHDEMQALKQGMGKGK